MSARQELRHGIVCDGCGIDFEYDEEFALFSSPEEAEEYAAHAGWTTDGEGKHHCDSCERLDLTQAARDARGRKLGPGDVPLEGLDR